MGSTTRRIAVAVVAAGLLVTVGCAKDETVSASSTTAPVVASSGGGSGTTEPESSDTTDKDERPSSGDDEEACAKIEQLEALPDDTAGDDGLALMAEARDAAPAELQDHWDLLIEVLTELSALDEESEEAMIKAFELMEDPEFLAAAKAIDDFAEEECGLDIDLDPSEESGGGLTETTTDADDDPASIDAVQAHLELRFGSERWYSVLDENVTWGSSGSSDVTWTVAFGDDPSEAGMTTADLLDVCDTMATYLDTHEKGDVTIEFSDPDDAVIASRQPGEDCEAA